MASPQIGKPPSDCVRILGFPWSVAVGVSVAAVNIWLVRINSHVTEGEAALHAIYVTTLVNFISGALLIPVVALEGVPWGKPTTWYSLLGGPFSVANFITIPACTYLSVQVVLLALLLGMLATGMMFDFRDQKLTFAEHRRWLGFVVTLAGVVIDYFGPALLCTTKGSSGPGFSMMSLLYALACVAGGACLAFMAKCNSQLAADVGSTQRAALICAICAVILTLPLTAGIYFRIGVMPRLSINDWPYWLASALQFAFYSGSVAVLPGLLGYTTNNIVMLTGKLGASSIIDAAGWAGKVAPFDAPRVVGVLMVLIGNILFAEQSGGQLLYAGQLPSNEDLADEDKDSDGSHISADGTGR